jgi:excisionase family DNA binding protein
MKSRITSNEGFKEFYTVAQLAKLLQLTEMTIYRMVNRGELPHYRIGRVKRFRSSDVELFLESHREAGNSGGHSKDDHTSTKSAPPSDSRALARQKRRPRREKRQ